MAKMLDSTLLAIVDQRCRDTDVHGTTTLSKDRTDAMRYYRGDKFGDEQEGRSQVVSRDVAESIDSTLPSLMRIFSSGDQVVMCEPTGPEDEDAAQQATDYANYVWNRVNPGFRIFYWMFKDALLQKLGIVKVWWDATPKVTREEYEGATLAQLEIARADPDNEIIEESEPYEAEDDGEGDAPMSPAMTAATQMPLAMASPGAPPMPPGLPPVPMSPGAPPPMTGPPPMPPGMPMAGPPQAMPPGMAMPNIPPGMPGAPPMLMPPMPPPPEKLVDFVVRKTNKTGRICISNVPNEEFGMARGAISVEDANYTHHRRKMTLSDLKAMGYSQDKIDQIPADDLWSLNAEKLVRFEDDGTSMPEDSGVMDPSMRAVWLTEAYLLVDYDGDGVAEMRRVTWAGNQIFDNEECDENPFAACTPTLMPHKAVGLSMADQTMDLQRIKSTLLRNFLDNVYLQSAPALAVNDDQVVDYNEWLTRRVGQIVRTKGPPGAAFAPLPTQFVGGEIFPVVEYIDSVREQRTGTTRYNQGLDANSLNKTATGINMIQQAAGQRIELIARSFAETGVKPAFRKLLKLASQYVKKAEKIRLRGQWVDVDPRAWANGFDMSVSVGLGTGNKDQVVAHMMGLLQVDQQIIQMQQGVQGPLLTAGNLYNKLEKLVQAMGMHSVEPYYSDPDSPKMQAQLANKPPPQPSPEIMAIQTQQQLNAATAQNNQHKLQVDAMDKQATQQLAMRKQSADEQYKQRELDIREREAAIKEAELGIKSSDTQIRASLEQAKIVDGQQARADTQAAAREARMHEAMVARDAAFGTPANGQPAPLELMQQHAQRLDALAGAVESLKQPKRGRMMKRADGVWDFHVEAPGGDAGNGVNGNV